MSGKNWGWVLMAGLAFVLLGIFTMNWPIASTLGLTYAIGTMLLVGGCILGVHALQLRKEPGLGWNVFQAIIAVVAGVLMLRYPSAGMGGLAIAMASYFFMTFAAKMMFALSLRPLKGWGWVMVSALVSCFLGIYIVAFLPAVALWIPGFILGVDFVVYGISLLGVSFDLKKLAEQGGHGRITAAF